MATPDPESAPAAQPLYDQDTAPHLTRALALNDSPRVTRLLADVRSQTGALNQAGTTTTSLRQPVVIRGGGRKPTAAIRAPSSRKWVINSVIVAVVVVLTLLTGLAVAPLATGNGSPFSLFWISGAAHNNNDSVYNTNLVAQAATATAIVRQDGYDPNSNSSTNGIPTIYSGSGVTPNYFAYGQCTYWADLEYHNKANHWVQWGGDAYQWAAGARAAGWIVSTTPHVYSIIVLQPYVQGAGYYGHVAVVEKINPDGSVYTSNMNWYANGGWNYESWWTFTPGPGVLFVWHV
jgi:surface antigen